MKDVTLALLYCVVSYFTTKLFCVIYFLCWKNISSEIGLFNQIFSNEIKIKGLIKHSEHGFLCLYKFRGLHGSMIIPPVPRLHFLQSQETIGLVHQHSSLVSFSHCLPCWGYGDDGYQLSATVEIPDKLNEVVCEIDQVFKSDNCLHWTICQKAVSCTVSLKKEPCLRGLTFVWKPKQFCKNMLDINMMEKKPAKP